MAESSSASQLNGGGNVESCLNCQMDKVWHDFYCATCWRNLAYKMKSKTKCFICHKNPRTSLFPQICEVCTEINKSQPLTPNCIVRSCTENRMANFTSIGDRYCTSCLFEDWSDWNSPQTFVTKKKEIRSQHLCRSWNGASANKCYGGIVPTTPWATRWCESTEMFELSDG